MRIDWQKNQNGAWVADYGLSRLHAARSGPGLRTFTAKLDGKFVGTLPDLESAKTAAEYAAAQKIGRLRSA